MSEILQNAFDQGGVFTAQYSELMKRTQKIIGIITPDKASKQRAIDGLMAGTSD